MTQSAGLLIQLSHIKKRGVDDWLCLFLSGLMGLTVLLLLLIVAFLILEAWPAIHGDGWRQFLRSDGWYPLEGKLGLLPMFWASIAVGVGALLVALPFGLGSAVFIAYYAPKVIGKPFAGVITLLAGVPSVVFGLWGLTELVPLVNQWHPPGASLFTAIIVLAIMILPTISLTSYSALLALPTQLQLNSAALALSKKTMVVGVLIPAAWRGITVGVLLAIARALGETLAVLMVAGNVVQMPTGLFEPVRVLTANIALEMAYATDNHRAALFASGLMLMFVVFLIALGASKLSKKEMSPI